MKVHPKETVNLKCQFVFLCVRDFVLLFVLHVVVL